MKQLLKTLAGWTRGVQTTTQQINPFQPRKEEITPQMMIDANVSWVNICVDRLSSRTSAVPLRLYATRAIGEPQFRNYSRQCRPISKNARKALIERCENTLPSVKVARLKQAQEVVEIVTHPFLNLLDRMNDIRTKHEVFKETQQFIDLTGNGYWQLDFDVSGLPSAIWLMPSQNVRILESRSQFIAGYSFGPNPSSLAQSQFLPYENVVHFRRPNPADPYYGMGCLQAAFKAFDLSEAAKDYNIALNRNMGVPSIIATFKDITSTDGNINKFKRLFQKQLVGVEKSGGVFVTTGDMDIKVVGETMREMAYLDGKKWSRKEIIAAFSVGEALLEVDNVNRANAEAASVTFEKEAILPRLMLKEAVMNKRIIPYYGEDRIFCAYDNNIPQDSQFELNKATQTFTTGITQRNESRAMINLPPLSAEEGGEDFVLVGGQIIGGQPATQIEGDK